MPPKLKTLEDLFTGQTPSFFEGASGLILSCSGGCDSTALFHLLNQQMKFDKTFPLLVYHFNYGLRGNESDEDQEFVESLAKTYKIPILIKKISQEERETRSEKNIQAWARSIRIEAFKEFTKKGWIIALAHQKDDLVENVLLRMIRGTSPGSLLGMSEWHPPFWRPLLKYSREEIVSWLSRHKLPHRHDSSNDKIEYSRNAIRHNILPELTRLNAKAKDNIIRCAEETQTFVKYTRASFRSSQLTGDSAQWTAQELSQIPKEIAYDLLSCKIGDKSRVKIKHSLLEKTVDTLHSSQKKRDHRLVQLPEGRSLVTKNGSVTLVDNCGTLRDKPRFKQHLAAITGEKKSFILGPAARVDFFPFPAEDVLDQKFRVCNSDLVAKKFNGF